MVPRAVGFTIVWPEGVIFGSSVTNGLLSSRDATVIETLRTVVERDLRGILKDVGELSHIAEKELHAVMLACKRARQQTLSSSPQCPCAFFYLVKHRPERLTCFLAVKRRTIKKYRMYHWKRHPKSQQ